MALLSTGVPGKVTVNGKSLPQELGYPDAQEANALAKSPHDAFYYNNDLDVTFIKVFDVVSEFVIVAESAGASSMYW